MTEHDFFEKIPVRFNAQQADAVRNTNGAVLLLAVPGSGKTTVLIARLLYMIYVKGIPADNILLLTYTRAAAGDMKRRYDSFLSALSTDSGIREAVYKEAGGTQPAGSLSGAMYYESSYSTAPEFRTINGICSLIIAYSAHIYDKNAFSVLSSERDITGIISEIYREVEEDYPTEADLKNVRTLITYIKNSMLTDEQIRAMDDDEEVTRNVSRISEIYLKYNQTLRSRQVMDYDDQMVYAYRLLKGSSRVLQHFRNKFLYICVDEAQDTSKIQHAIISLLAGDQPNLFMVGDEDQSIYGFRAAYPEALLTFETDHQGSKVLYMEENYRSTDNIIKAADSFINKNTLRHAKHMNAARHIAGRQIRYIEVTSRYAQYSYLAKAVAECDSAPFDDDGSQTKTSGRSTTAVLYRDNESIIPLVDILERENIPYRIRNADVGFFSNRIVRDITNIVIFAQNPDDTDLFLQIYYKIRTYLSRQEAYAAVRLAQKHRMNVLDALIKYGRLNKSKLATIESVNDKLNILLKQSASDGLDTILYQMGYLSYLERMKTDTSRIPILKILSYKEDSLLSLLQRLDFLNDTISSRENDPNINLILSTIHSSKGLEYSKVYMIDVIDGVFPKEVYHGRKNGSDKHKAWEEERRLFYVGITRAKDELNIFEIKNSSSTFTKQLKGEYEESITVSVTPMPKKRRQTSRGRQAEVSPVQKKPHFDEYGYGLFMEEIGEGIMVEHKKFGSGIIAAISGDEISIQFDDQMRKFNAKVLYMSRLLKL